MSGTHWDQGFSERHEKKDFYIPLVAAFTVQEKVGRRVAKDAAYPIALDFAIVIEGFTADAGLDYEKDGLDTELGKGPSCSLMDKTTLYNRKLVQWAADIARKKGISLQYRLGVSGGNDAGPIHVSQGGIPTIALCIPRYVHNPSEMINKRDVHAAVQLLGALLEATHQGT